MRFIQRCRINLLIRHSKSNKTKTVFPYMIKLFHKQLSHILLKKMSDLSDKSARSSTNISPRLVRALYFRHFSGSILIVNNQFPDEASALNGAESTANQGTNRNVYTVVIPARWAALNLRALHEMKGTEALLRLCRGSFQANCL